MEQREDMLHRRDILCAISSVYPVIVSANLSKNTYMKLEYQPIIGKEQLSYGKFDDLINMGLHNMEPGFQKLFLDTFSREVLIDKFSKGEKDVYLELKQICIDGKEHWLEIHVIFIPKEYIDLKEICFMRIIDEKKEEELKWKRQFITMNNEIRHHELSLRKTLEYEKLTNECMQMFYRVTNLKQSVDRFMELTGTQLQADRAFVCEIHNEQAFCEFEYCAKDVLPKKEFIRGLDIHLFDYWMPQLLEEKYIIVKDVNELPEEEENLKRLFEKHNIRELFLVPVTFEDEMRLVLGYDNPKFDNEDFRPMIDTLMGMALVGINRVYMEQKRNILTYKDSMTNLWNRTRMNEDIGMLKDKTEGNGILFLDVNGLKETNDKFSHEAGDALLRACARVIKEQFPECDNEKEEEWTQRAYRIGGDEFVVWIKDISEEDFKKKEEDLRNAYKNASDCSVSIGGIFEEKDGDIYHMIKQADHFMYEDKKEYYKNHDRRSVK